MIRATPKSNTTEHPFPYQTLFRSRLMIASDPPDHTKLRRVVSRPFQAPDRGVGGDGHAPHRDPGRPARGAHPGRGLGRPHQGTRCPPRSEEHTSELQSLMRTSYAVFCLKKKKTNRQRAFSHT